MNKVFRIVSLLAVLMMITGSAMAYDHAYHVKQAPNGKGDAIIFPMYFAAPGGWETKLTVVNTSTTYSTIAKVVFRSHFYSQEILDFLIYLTPADVWTGFVRHDGTNVYVYSEDDSVLISNTQFASKTSPMRQNMFAVACPSIVADERTTMSKGDSGDMGYVEVVETWYGDLSANYPVPIPSTLSRIRPVSKDYFRQLYSPTAGPVTTASSPAGLTGTTNSGSIDHTINILSGYVELRNSLIENTGTMMQGTVLADTDVISYMNAADASGLRILGTTGSARNTLGELEAALSKDNFSMPYVNNSATGEMTVHLFNFPTKNTVILSGSSMKDAVTGDCRYQNASSISPFWYDPSAPPSYTTKASSAYRCLNYGYTVFDTMENGTGSGIFSGGSISTRWCEELELVVTSGYSSLFTEGWTNYNPNYASRTGASTALTKVSVARTALSISSLGYTGVPVIPFALIFKPTGLAMVPGAYEDGAVYAIQNTAGTVGTSATWDDTTNAAYSRLPEYQYWNAMSELGLHTLASAYPAAVAGVCGNAGIYWDSTNNYPCIPVQSPR